MRLRVPSHAILESWFWRFQPVSFSTDDKKPAYFRGGAERNRFAARAQGPLIISIHHRTNEQRITAELLIQVAPISVCTQGRELLFGVKLGGAA